MDDDLRRREREVRADAEPGELRRYARALERSGRRGDAVEALLPRRGDPEVRRELARLWGEVHLNAGAWDARGPASTPRPRWTRRLARRIDEVDEPELLAPALSVGPLVAFIVVYDANVLHPAPRPADPARPDRRVRRAPDGADRS